MSDKFIYSELSSKNAFISEMSIFIFDKFYSANIKIDTGAYGIFIPLKTLGIKEDRLNSIKKFFVYNNLKSVPLRGVEGSFKISVDDYYKMSYEERMKYEGMAFFADFKALTIDNYFLGNGSCKISCDTEGNILLGMDVLKHFDIHIGVSNDTGKCTFIGCQKDKLNNEYLDALFTHFGYLPKDLVEQAYKKAFQDGSDLGFTAGSWRNYLRGRKPKRIARKEFIR